MSAPPSRADSWRAQHSKANSDLAERCRSTFGRLVRLASEPQARLAAVPPDGGWSPAEVLEHVALADRFLLLLVDKLAERTRRRLARGLPWPDAPPGLEDVARAAASPRRWPHPEHMTPTGTRSPAESAGQLARDAERALAPLQAWPEGQGTLHRIRMSRVGEETGGDGRLDLYQYVELIVRHAERHARQIERALGA
ncbi:MAG: DinB family protein [Planctomycetota bacterium]